MTALVSWLVVFAMVALAMVAAFAGSYALASSAAGWL